VRRKLVQVTPWLWVIAYFNDIFVKENENKNEIIDFAHKRKYKRILFAEREFKKNILAYKIEIETEIIFETKILLAIAAGFFTALHGM